RSLKRPEYRFDSGSDNEATEDAGKERVGPQPVGAMVAVVDFADGVESRDARLLIARRAHDETTRLVALVVGPEASHPVVDGGEDLHRLVARIDPLELL